MSKQITLNINDNKYPDFLELIKNLDFVKIEKIIKPEPAKKEIELSHTDVIFGTGKPATDAQLKKYLSYSDSEETKELSMVCEDVNGNNFINEGINGKRILGGFEDKISVPDDFDEPLDNHKD